VSAADRDAILARRARFLSMALAAAGMVSASCDETEPRVCLTAPLDMKSPGNEARPVVCLAAPEDPEDGHSGDAGTGTPPDAGAGKTQGDAGTAPSSSATSAPTTAPTRPRVCLSQAPGPRGAKPCLTKRKMPDSFEEDG
jgi:hypothetical protein